MQPNDEHRNLGEGGYPPASWGPAADPGQRIASEKWLAGYILALGVCVAIGFFLNGSFGPQQMTARMERMVKQLNGLKVISPETAQAIKQAVSQTGYDCDRVDCDEQLKARNGAVRAELFSVLAKKRATTEPDLAEAPAVLIEVTSKLK